MKRLLMLKPIDCGAGDTKEGKIYDITKDVLNVLNPKTEDSIDYEYTEENLKKHTDGIVTRWVTINDESSEDTFEVEKNETRFIIFENDKELAHAMIDRVEGLAYTIANMAMTFMK